MSGEDGGDEGARAGSRWTRTPTLVVPAAWLALQATILLLALVVFTFRPGVVAERFPGFMAGAVIAAILLATARGLMRATVAGHLVAVGVFALESLAFAVSLLRSQGGPWAAAQLAVCVLMLVLLLAAPTRRALDRSRPDFEDELI